MKVELHKDYCLVSREDSPKVYSESWLWYQIKEALIEQGHDVVKKLMWKDGHLVDDTEYYIRDRKWGWCLRDDYYFARKLYEPYNADKTLRITRIYF